MGAKPAYRLYGYGEQCLKKNWFLCGAAWTRPNGSLSIHMESIPVKFNGQLMLHPVTPENEREKDDDTAPWED